MTPRYGNDDPYADRILASLVDLLHETLDGRPNTRGRRVSRQLPVDDVPRVLRVGVRGRRPTGARPGSRCRTASRPCRAPTAAARPPCCKSAAHFNHARTGGTLLNQKFTPQVVAGEAGLEKLAQLVRTYFRMGGHHIQFNVVTAETLRAAQREPEKHRDLIVRVAGYSDYFCDLTRALQDEIIARTEHQGL